MKKVIFILALVVLMSCKKDDCNIGFTDLHGTSIPIKDLVIIFTSDDTIQIGNNDCVTHNLNDYSISNSSGKTIDFNSKKIKSGDTYLISSLISNKGDVVYLKKRKKTIHSAAVN